MEAAGGSVGHAEGLWAPARRGLVTGLVLSTTFIAAEAMAVITIMPRVAHQLGGIDLYGWVFSAFMLASLVGTVAAGRAADRSGPAGPFAAGLVLFGCGLALAGLAPSMGVLVLARVVQGLGAGAVPAICYVAIGRALPARLRPAMLAVLSSAWLLPGLLGPVASVEIADVFGWRWVFLGLIPLVAVAGGLALPALVALGRPPAGQAGEHRLRDAVLTAAGAGIALAGLTAGSEPAAALVVPGALIGLPALRRLLPAGTLAAREGLPATILSRGLLTFAFFGCDAFVTLAITAGLHHSTAVASVAITVSTLAWTLGAWGQARLSDSWEGQRLVRAGLALVLVGIAGMIASLDRSVPVAEAIAAWSLAGLGMGLAYAPTSLMMMREAPRGREGAASASLTLSDVLGTALGTGLGGAALVLGASRGWSISTALVVAFAIAGGAAVAAIAVSGRLPLQGPARGADPRGRPVGGNA